MLDVDSSFPVQRRCSEFIPLAFTVHCGYLVGVWGWGVYFKVKQAGNCFDNVNALLNMRHYLIPLFSIPFLLPNTTELCTRTPLCPK